MGLVEEDSEAYQNILRELIALAESPYDAATTEITDEDRQEFAKDFLGALGRELGKGLGEYLASPEVQESILATDDTATDDAGDTSESSTPLPYTEGYDFYPEEEESSDSLNFFWGLIAFVIIYFVPSIFASLRRSRASTPLLIANILAG